MNMRTLAAAVVALSCTAISTEAQEPGTIARWGFDRVVEGKTPELVSGIEDEVEGNYRLMSGIRGEALVLDGYTTCVVRSADLAPEMAGDFTIEAWIALGAYPWNWAPIAARENTVSLNSNLDAVCWPEDITINSPRAGFFFGVGPQGQLGLHMGAGEWRVIESGAPIPLRKWTHVAATFTRGEGVALYMDGERTGGESFGSDFSRAGDEDLRIGMGRQQLEPTNPVREFATLACWYSLDGILDELQIHDTALSEREIADSVAAVRLSPEPPLKPRVMPSGPEGQGVFGASYMNLEYYPEWDALWPVSSDPDIVVQFDDSPVRVVFWRGTRYGPAWVMENGLWMADQSLENFNNTDGCLEHMLDPRCRFSHVRIIENTDARVVVHWRYCPTSANGNHSQVDPISGWEDWVDEYYTFYPDQVGIRKVIQHSTGSSLHPEEIIGLCHPGQTPEDVIELDAMTMASLDGRSHTYSWAEGTPVIHEGGEYIHFGREPEERPVILQVNMKSEMKPFRVFETDNRVRIFAIEHRKGFSRFPWWNHWPVAQVPSDGRYCQVADRASHFSLAWGGPQPHRGEGDFLWWTWMYGASTGSTDELTPLARSWNLPPELVVTGGGFTGGDYDRTERAYRLAGTEGRSDALSFRLQADTDSPVVNIPVLIENWGSGDASLKIDGRDIPRGRSFRYGHIRRINRYDLVVWIEHRSDRPVEIELIRSLDR